MMRGGHVEPGETLEEAAVREVAEETGLEVRPVAVFSWKELIGPAGFHRPAHFLSFCVHCRVLSGSRVVLDQEELTNFCWIAPEQAASLNLAVGFSDVLQEFLAYTSLK